MKKVHLRDVNRPIVGSDWCVCGIKTNTAYTHSNNKTLTTDPAKVTCKTCRNTKVWKAAWAKDEKVARHCGTCKYEHLHASTTECCICGKNYTRPNWQPIPPTPEVRLEDKFCTNCIDAKNDCAMEECLPDGEYILWQPIPPDNPTQAPTSAIEQSSPSKPTPSIQKGVAPPGNGATYILTFDYLLTQSPAELDRLEAHLLNEKGERDKAKYQQIGKILFIQNSMVKS